MQTAKPVMSEDFTCVQDAQLHALTPVSNSFCIPVPKSAPQMGAILSTSPKSAKTFCVDSLVCLVKAINWCIACAPETINSNSITHIFASLRVLISVCRFSSS